MATNKRPTSRTKTTGSGTKTPAIRTVEFKTPSGGSASGRVVPQEKSGTAANRGRRVGSGSSGSAHTNYSASQTLQIREVRTPVVDKSTGHRSGKTRGQASGSVKKKTGKF